MMRSIVRASMQYRFLVIVIAGALMLAGVNQTRNMPVDVLPEFSPPYVEIQTEALGLSAEEVEQMITVPMEQDLLAAVPWLDVLRSRSVPGLSSVVVYFESGTDIYRARQLVGERIAQSAVGLPHVSKPPTMIQPLSSASRFMIIGLSSEEMSLVDLSVLARWTIAPRLMGVPGVAHVAIWGNRERQLQVLVNPEDLQAKGVTLDQVIETTGNALWVSPLTYLEASSPGTGGFIDTPNQRLTVWHVLPISSAEELAKVPVDGTNGLLLSDVAQVVEDHQPLIGDAVVNDSPNLLIVIEKLPEVNTLEVTRGVDQALLALHPGLPGVQFDATLFRPASFIDMAIANILQALVIAALLIVVILGLLMYGWRTALISLLTILSSLAAALVVLYVRGATLNSMVLGGLVIALGLIIDEAVVDVENVMRRLRQNRQEGGLRLAESVILEASAETRGALFFATLVTLLAAVPLFFVEGLFGDIFRPMVVSYTLSVLAAMITALTVTPALSMIFLSGKQLNTGESPFVARLQNGYERMLARSVNRAGLANIVIVVLIVAGIVVMPLLTNRQMLPAFHEPYLTIKVEGAPSTSRPEMSRMMTLMGNELRSISGVTNVGAHVGRAVFGDQVVGINSAELWVSIDPKADYDATVTAVQNTVDGYTGMVREVRTYVQQTLSEPQVATPKDDFTVRLYGEDMNVMRAEADKLEKLLAGISGITSTHQILPVEEPILQIEVDLAAAQQHGVKPGEVRRAAATYLSGILVGSLFEEQKIFDVVVWGAPEIRDSISDVSNLLILRADGTQVRLGDVAEVKIVPAQTVIYHDNMSPFLDIGVSVQGRSAGVVVGDVKGSLAKLSFPLEYHVEVLNEFATRQASQQRILVSILVAVVGIFLLLQASTRSWRMALATFLLLPAAVAGGALMAFLTGSALSLASLFGLLAILGIGVRNAMALVDRYQYLEVKKGVGFGSDLVLRGACERLAPTMISALTTGTALLPFVFMGNIPGLELVRPMAVIILGGLVASTLLNLFALPALYLRYGASREPDLGFQTAAGLSATAADD